MAKIALSTFHLETLLHVIDSYDAPVTKTRIVSDYPMLEDYDIAGLFNKDANKPFVKREGVTAKRTFELTKKGANYLKQNESTVQNLDDFDLSSAKPAKSYKKRKKSAPKPPPAPEPQFTGSAAAMDAINAAAMIVETSNQAREILGQINTLCSGYFEKFENDYAEEATGIFRPVIEESLHFRELLTEIKKITEPMEEVTGHEPEQHSLIEGD